MITKQAKIIVAVECREFRKTLFEYLNCSLNVLVFGEATRGIETEAIEKIQEKAR